MTIYENFQLSDILWYKVGGIAKYVIDAQSEEDVERAIDFIEKKHIEKTFFCGLGSNLIFSDGYYEGAVVRIVAQEQTTQIDQAENGLVTVFAGEVLDTLIQFSFAHNLIGLEWAGGLPGTVGAGVRGNVGAFGGEIKDRFVKAKVLEWGNSGFGIKVIEKDDFRFAYRTSIIKEQKNLIVLNSTFQLNQAEENAQIRQAQEVYAANIQYRKTHHPLEYPTCGSVFKNIARKEEVDQVLQVWPDVREKVETRWHGKVSMGYIIHRLGLTGYRVGNMQISEKHSNFIINLGEAKAADVLTIIEEIQKKVAKTLGFTPEIEVEIVY